MGCGKDGISGDVLSYGRVSAKIAKNEESLMAEIKKDRSLIDGLLDIIRGIKNNLKIRIAKSEKAMLDEAERNLVNLLRSESGEQIQARYAVKLNETDIKSKQLEAIRENNPADDDIHTWIRTVDDIKTAQEVFGVSEDDFSGAPDWTYEDAQKALRMGKVMVYSSKPIKTGSFVTPSKMEAESYSGNGRIYKSMLKIKDIAWIDDIQGQYVKIKKDDLYAEYQKNIQSKNGIKFEMNEKERYEALKNIEIKLFDATSINVDSAIETVSLFSNKSDIQKELIKIGDKLNIFENYSTDDVDFEFKMSHGTINESVEKQEYSYADLTKAINFVRNVVENAVVIDIHRDKYIGTERR